MSPRFVPHVVDPSNGAKNGRAIGKMFVGAATLVAKLINSRRGPHARQLGQA